MFWQYLLVFIAAFLTDLIAFPLPPAFVFMVFLQITFKLNIWWVIGVGVMGSIIGRYLLTLYIPFISSRIFKPSKNEDVQFLGAIMRQKGWKSQAFILAYSLLPLPTTPLFIAGGMAKMPPYYIIPMFIVGKFASDMTAVLMGKYAAENTAKLIHGLLSWKSIAGLVLAFLLIFALLFIDWRTLIQDKKFTLKFKIWK